MDSVSLLPPNATSFEHALAASMQAITALPVPVRAVRDPQQCPLALLPWLAVHHGVDEWDDSWPEAVQRAMIAGSYADKMRRGTRAAVVQAMTALGVPVLYENAFEYGGRPYCFRLTLGLDGQTPWTQPQAALLVRLVNRTKAKRSLLDSVVMTRAAPAASRAIADDEIGEYHFGGVREPRRLIGSRALIGDDRLIARHVRPPMFAK